MTDPLTAPALAQALEELREKANSWEREATEQWKVNRERGLYCDAQVKALRYAIHKIEVAAAAPALPGETPAEPPLDRPTFEFSCPCCGDPFALTKELDVDIHSGATYRCALCDGKVIFDAIAADKYGAPPAVAPVAREIQQPQEPRRSWPDPTPEMLESDQFERVWQCIKRWDINVPDVYVGYMGANGNHVRAILEALAPPPSRDREEPR